jgi:hypothetical protein
VSRPAWARAARSHPVFTGISRQHLGELIAELAAPWTAATRAPCTSVAATRVSVPPPKPAKHAPPEELAAYQLARKQQSSQRICVEHANAEHKQWWALQRWIGQREYYAETHLAIAGLVSDRAARR